MEKVVIPLDRNSNKLLGHAFIHFLDKKQAKMAIDRKQGLEIEGYRLHLEWSLPPEMQPPRSSSDSRMRHSSSRSGHGSSHSGSRSYGHPPSRRDYFYSAPPPPPPGPAFMYPPGPMPPYYGIAPPPMPRGRSPPYSPKRIYDERDSRRGRSPPYSPKRIYDERDDRRSPP